MTKFLDRVLGKVSMQATSVFVYSGKTYNIFNGGFSLLDGNLILLVSNRDDAVSQFQEKILESLPFGLRLGCISLATEQTSYGVGL